MVIVSSLDGRLTRGEETDFYKWASAEDQQFFKKLVASHNLIVMGGKTYQAAKDRIKLQASKLRLILTRSPKKYSGEQVTGQLEFTAQAPSALVKQLEKRGYKTMLLVGGQINTLFLKAGLVDNIYWTLEPLILGAGRTLVPDQILGTKLQLKETRQLNSQGTLLLKYKVVK